MTTTRPIRPCLALLSLVTALLLGACASSPMAEPPGPALAKVQFLDLQGFDRQLSDSLGAPLPQVSVGFVDVVKPSAMPERLQKWMAAVEAGGGKVTVTPPKSSVQAKGLFALVSAATTVWSASKMASSLANDAQFRSAKAYNAEIVLKADASGDSVIDQVIFVKR